MSIWQDIKTAWWNLLHMGDLVADSGLRERIEVGSVSRDYYAGEHRKQLRERLGQASDNLAINFIQLIVERGISLLLGQGIEFDMPGEPDEVKDPETGAVVRTDQPNQEYIDRVWRANKKDVLLHKVAQFGGMNGTCYLKVIPEGIEDPETGEALPRLVILDPLMMDIETMPEDIDTVRRYVMRFAVDIDGKWRGRKEVTERNLDLVDADGNPAETADAVAGFQFGNWTIINYLESENGKMEEIGREDWEYPFPPIVHWQNLPNAGESYGIPDITPNVIENQDRINFIASNISKIIRYHAHPKTWGRNAGQPTQQSWGADEMVVFTSDQAHIENLEMQSDLQSSLEFLQLLRQALFDITRTVDITSLKDKLGALTNFGLRVLFYDSLAKLNTKKELYGEALIDLNLRLCRIGEVETESGGRVIWPDTLPVSDQEEIEGLGFDLDRDLVSRETASTMRGYSYLDERNRINQEKESDRMSSDSIGSVLLRNFDRGLGGNGRPVDERVA